MTQLIPPSEVIVLRNERQRQEINDLEGLKASIKNVGLIHPIIIHSREDPILVVGERRLMAHIELGLEEIPFRTVAELNTEADLLLVELEENVRRKNLTWQEEAAAISQIHNTYKTTHEKWTLADTSEIVGTSSLNYIADAIEVDKLVKAEDKHTLQAASMAQARRVVKRKRNRAVDDELSKLTEPSVRDDKQTHTETASQSNKEKPVVLNADFHLWAPIYKGPLFNLIHCDFPYGIKHGQSDQGGANTRESYSDDEDVYWKLLYTLTEFQDKFISPSAHLIFWFHMNFYEETKNVLTASGWTVNPLPLIWHKTDNRGIVADVERRPRHIYETALFAARGDRKIIQPIADVYGAPTHKSTSLHISEKPEPVLKHFFGLCCDHLSRVLDPTCGAGSALRVADSMGATDILGLEIKEEFARGAAQEFTQARRLREASKGITI